MIGFIVAGLVIGLLARLLLPGRQKIGLLWTVALGILGSVVGGVIANLIGSGDVFELNVIGFIVAVIASVACWQPPNAQAWPRASRGDASKAEAAVPKISTCCAAEAGQTCRGTASTDELLAIRRAHPPAISVTLLAALCHVRAAEITTRW